MQNFLIRYSMKPEFADENALLLRAYLDELALAQPANMAYAINRLDDGISFFHLVQSDSGAAPFAHLSSFRARAGWAAEKYQDEPVMTEFDDIGAYHSA